MPNWCTNNLYIQGKAEDLRRFHDAVKRDNGYEILRSLVPTPQELTDTVSGWTNNEAEQAEREKQYAKNTAKYGYKDWYDWQYANWGTKWGDADTDLVGDNFAGGDIEFYFQTPWGPPIEGIATITKMFPELTFILSYAEEGMEFYGVTTFIDGDPIDVCENFSDIAGLVDIDWDADDYIEKLEHNEELINEARDALLQKAWQ